MSILLSLAPCNWSVPVATAATSHLCRSSLFAVEISSHRRGEDSWERCRAEIVSVPLKFHWFRDFYMVKNAKKPWGQKQRTWLTAATKPKHMSPNNQKSSIFANATSQHSSIWSFGCSWTNSWTAQQLNSYQPSGFMKSSNLLALRLCSFSKDKSTCSGRTRPPKS